MLNNSANNNSVTDFLKEKVRKIEYTPKVYEYGVVESCADEIVHIQGLSQCRYGELLEFAGNEYGVALDLKENGVGAVLLSKDSKVVPGDIVSQTGSVTEICVGEGLLGRTVDPIGRPLDGLGAINSDSNRPLEAHAPTIMQRTGINRPLETGILAVDSMIPIGRGQRELIIGDRQTGKTSIALTAMLNQRKGDVLCIYCAIGQKASTVASVVDRLRRENALDNTVIVASTADDSAAMQYLTPYAGCAIAEEFMYDGKDVLIVYDDLSKHAIAYRSMSLLLRRPSGREAYPGDVFYLHSRLLERAAKLSEDCGGGSMTALPIIETMSGDISAYIPTNVISITDGQIYLESELFNSGVRPAVNVGLSVSRVGRSAQYEAMKKVSGSLRLELAQYRDTAVFAQFGADIDESTAKLLANGARLTQLLKQNQNTIFALSEQVALLLAANEGLLAGVEPDEICNVRMKLLEYLNKNIYATMHSIDNVGKLTDRDRETLVGAEKQFFASLRGE